MDDPVRRSYDAVSAEYVRRIAGELADRPLDRGWLDAFAEWVRPLGPACDLGCGPGHVGAYLASRGLEVVGVDLSPGQVAEGRRRFPEVRFAVGDMRRLPLADGALGGVAAFYSIIHLERDELPRVLAELRRVLVPRGVLLLAFHVGERDLHLDEWWGQPVCVDFRFLAMDEVTAQVGAAGFAVEATMLRTPGVQRFDGPERRGYVMARRS